MDDEYGYESIGVEVTEQDGKFGFIIELVPGAPGTYNFDSGFIYDSQIEAQMAGYTAASALEADANEH